MNKLKLSILLFLIAIGNVFSQIEKKYVPYKALEGETIQTISQKFSITPYDLLKLNPDIKDGISEGQVIIVPNKNYSPLQDEEKGDYVKDGFLYHKVKPQENYFRLKQEYGVSKKDLRKYNLELRSGDLKAGQVIKIPVSKGFKLDKEDIPMATKPYLVKPKETKYSIAKRYGITVERLEELNPHLKEVELKLAEIIKVPDIEEIPVPNKDSVTHQVEKGETLFSLSQKFRISQQELIEANPFLKDGVKEGALIEIPKASFSESTQLFVANIPEERELNVVMMLPFTSGKGTVDFENDKTLEIVTDFYLGSLQALDSLKKQGLSINLKVFDTQNNKVRISNYFTSNNFEDVDLLIGPMYLENVKLATQLIQNNDIAIISPASSKDHSFATKNVIKEIPSDEELAEQILEYIKDSYEGQNIIAVIDEVNENQAKFNKIINNLNKIDSLKSISIIKPEKGYIKPAVFKSKINEEKDNWIVLLTEDDVIATDVVNNLGVQPEKVKLTLFSTIYDKNFERMDNNFLTRINFHYPISTYVDNESEEVRNFTNTYKTNNYIEPSEYAFKGFDIVYDALLRLATYPEYENAFQGGLSERLSTKFNYVKKGGRYFENKGGYIVKFEELQLKKVQ
ncbi:MAG: LysM peptidoglycan-binding domain-containing protein [Flavobacteriaceae bacterium]|nr:LysM peptidoglycan-binding domain-containing protein [Flavobacteriaceae bacterium]